MESLDLTSSSRPAQGLSVFGKTTAHGDFIRVQVASPAAIFVQRWIEDAHMRRVSSGIAITSQLLQFAIRPPDTSALVIGAIAPSRDAVGRVFPLAIFVTVEASMAPRPALVPLVAQVFLEAVSALLASAEAMTATELEARLVGLPSWSEGLARSVTVSDETKQSQRAETFAERCLGEPLAPSLAYAIDTLGQASLAARTPKSAGRELVLDCPMAIDVDLFAWLSLADAVSPDRPTSFVWTEEKPQLLLTFGAATGGLLAFVDRNDSRSSALWPVITQNERARVEALHRLPGNVRQCGERGGTLDDLIASVAAARSTWR